MARREFAPVRFEIQVFKRDHWVTDRVVPTEDEARQVAVDLLNRVEGVRILREFIKSSGEAIETIIYNELRSGTQRPIVLVPIEEAPSCQTGDDFLRPESRLAISRILRNYLEYKRLTASELLHNATEMRRLMNFQQLLPNAIGRMAALQSKHGGTDAHQRRDALWSAIDSLKKRCETACRRDLPFPKESGFRVAMGVVEAATGGDAAETAYLGRVMVCRDLVHIENLYDKIAWLLDMSSDAATPPRHLAVLDSLAADVVCMTAVVQDLLGAQPDLGTALGRLVDLIEGRFDPNPREMAPPVSALIGQWVASGLAPQTRQALCEALMRSLSGTQPLGRGSQDEQIAQYQRLLARLLPPADAPAAGLLGGPKMAEAMTRGFLRFVVEGGRTGRRLSVEGVLALLPHDGARLTYLANLSLTDVAAQDPELVAGHARTIFARVRSVADLVPPGLEPVPLLRATSALYLALVDSGFPEAERTQLAGRLDGLVADHIIDTRLVQRLDDPAGSLRQRATRLVEFAAAGILASPKAARIIRNQIVDHLRRPNFERHFVQDIADEAEKTSALRAFHALLAKANFT